MIFILNLNLYIAWSILESKNFNKTLEDVFVARNGLRGRQRTLRYPIRRAKRAGSDLWEAFICSIKVAKPESFLTTLNIWMQKIFDELNFDSKILYSTTNQHKLQNRLLNGLTTNKRFHFTPSHFMDKNIDSEKRVKFSAGY